MVVVDILGVVNEVTSDPLVNTEPPLEDAYQSIASSAGPPNPDLEADILTVPVEHLVPFVPEGVAGNALTVAVTAVLVAEIQPVVVFLASA
jgi:hypothetical protein